MQALDVETTWLDGRASLALQGLPEPPKLPNELAQRRSVSPAGSSQAAKQAGGLAGKHSSPVKAASSPAATPSPLRAKRAGSLTSKMALLAIPEDMQGEILPSFPHLCGPCILLVQD